MPRKSKTRILLDSIVHPKLLALRKEKIGPIWPNPEELKGVLKGVRGQPRKKTVFPFDDAYREKRRKRKRIASWSKNGKAYRYSFGNARGVHRKTDTERDITGT